MGDHDEGVHEVVLVLCRGGGRDHGYAPAVESDFVVHLVRFIGLADSIDSLHTHASLEYELVPMLREYWLDDPTKVREWSAALRRAIR